MTKDLIVEIKHLRQLRICHRGARRMAEQLGLDWNKILSDGIPLSEIPEVDDVMVKRLINHVKGQNNGR